jgi:UDP-N-acetyl-2-amino-2-deoxyglucuronate dehydrogenase
MVGVCDIVKEKAEAFSRDYGVKAYYSLNDMLASERTADVAVVCTPNGLHAEQSIAFLKSGMNVLCEKPMAISVNDCLSMIAEAKKAEKKLFIVKQNRYNPPLQTLKQIIEEGGLGRIFSFQLNCFWNRKSDYYQDDWRGTLKMDGGTLFTQFSHFIDILHWLMGDVRNTKALLANYAHKGIIEFEDTGMVIFEFNNGVTGAMNYTVNSFGKNFEGSITVFGEKGTVKVGGEYLNKLEYQNIQDFVIQKLPEGNGSNDYGSYSGSMSNHDKVYENLMAFLHNEESLSVSAEDGKKTVEIIEKIYENAVRIKT